MKHLLFCITLAFCSFEGVYAQSAMPEAETSPKWVAKEHPSLEFPYIFIWDGCSVSVEQEGEGVTVDAYDQNWRGKHITQTIMIKKNSGGDFYKLSYTRETNVTNTGYIFSIDTEGYDVFEAKCREAVKSLPIGIQKTFHCFYGLGCR